MTIVPPQEISPNTGRGKSKVDEAASRLHRYRSGESGYKVWFPEYVGKNHDWTLKDEDEYIIRKRRDVELLADAYLEEHPPIPEPLPLQTANPYP